MTDPRLDGLLYMLKNAIEKYELVSAGRHKSVLGYMKAEIGRLEGDRVGKLIVMVYRASGMVHRFVSPEIAAVVLDFRKQMEDGFGCGKRK